jgi:putative membrane protein
VFSGRVLLAAALGLLYGVMWLGGVSAYVLHGGPRPHEAWAAPTFLALSAAIVLVTTAAANAGWLGVVLVLGFVAEYAGVRCGCIFGAYEYTTALSPRLLGVPVVMSAAWMVLVAYLQQLRLIGAWPRTTAAVVCATWMTAIDLVLDPVAAGPLRYWTWLAPGSYYGVPLRNFAGWFVVSLLMFALLSAAAWRPNPWARYVGLTIVAFFTIIAASHRMVVPSLAGVLLCAADLWLARRARLGAAARGR